MNHQPRIRPLFQLATRFLPLLALGILSVLTAFAAPPDLTAPGVIAGIDRSETYNLGPTGLRGWIHITRTNTETHGANGTMTGESRQILVTVASAPANTVLAVDDVILGAMAASTGEVPLFSSDARKAFATAITEAEKTVGGTLRVKRWRAGTTADVNIPITIMGDYTATAPYNCPKSALILANARNKLVTQLKADANFLSGYWDGSITALALLAGVQPGDPDATIVEDRLRTHARNLASAGPQPVGLPIWTWAYNGLFLAEYYLLTGDANVLPGIQSYTLRLAQSQSMYGTYGHGPAILRPDGSGRLMGTGYGPVNAAGIVANMAIVMGKKALVAGSQTVDPEINTAIQRGSDFFKFYVNKGVIPYGEHEPVPIGHMSNGKDPMCAVFFGLQPDRATETEYFTRMTIASYNGREYGHTGQGFSYLWSALGANMGGALAVAEHLKPVRWHLDLSRRTDGSFAYDGAEQYGGGSTSGGTYLGASGYYGLNTTATYLLTYSLPLQRLYITGKRDVPANPPALNLDANIVAHAIAAGNFKAGCPTFTTAALISSLGNYDPVVRHCAAVELGKRSAIITSTELSTLRTMLTGPDANARMGAAQALGLLKDSTALPTLAQRLDKTTEPDLWVRAKAASAIREYTAATISTHRDAMLTAFVDNATDPDNIDWSDPIQTSNSYLSFALFGNAIYGGTHIGAYTINAPKNLLYPALETGLKHPDSMPRSGVSQFCIDRLPLADVQAVIPAFFKVVESECLADRMWHMDARVDGIATLSKYKISEGIPYALNMVEIPEGFEWGSPWTQVAGLNALAAYGDAARWTLPKLKSYLGKWPSGTMEYNTLVSTIATIENAITAPAQNPGLAVANSQILITTGPIALTLSGSSPRSAVTFANVTQPLHGTLTGTAPNLTYTPNSGYTGPDFFTFQVVDSLGASYPSAPGTVSLIVGSAGTGLKGEYFDNPDFTNPVLTRTDAKVDFDWGTGSPHASVGPDTFSVRWTGLLLVPESGNYTFSSLSSEGMRLYVNGTLVIDNFTDQSTRWTDGTPIYLSKGQMADILIEYYENTGSAVAKLKWSGPSFAGANGSIIPQAYFFDGSTISNRPAFAFSQNLSTDKNTALPITLKGSGGSLTYTVLTLPANGTLSGTAPNLIYTPNTNFTGTDSFTFYVNNGSTNSLPATVTIGVQAGPLTHFTWATATTGNWSDASKWTPSAPVAAGQPNYALNFNATGVYTATHNLNSGFQLNQLNIGGNVTINGTQSLSFVANGGSQPTFNHNGGALATVVSPIHLAALTEFGGSVSSSGKVELTKQITGTGGIVKNGAGKLCIYGVDSNNFSGGTIINNGTLTLSAYVDGVGSLDAINPLGTGPVTLNGATIEFQRVSAANHPLTVNGGTLFSDNGWGATWSGPITLNQTLTTRTNWPLTLSGTVSGSSGIVKTGSNTLTLSGTNTYTGTTEIREGTLTCNNSSALGNGPLIITSPGKANLNFTGTRPIASLTLNGTAMSPGTYGSTASTATNKNNTYFSGTGTVTVLQATTTSLNLTSGSSPAASGSSLTFTATVTGSSPTGNVQFFSGNTLLGTSALNGSFQAAFTTNQLAIGPHSITARYVGNSSNGSSNSAAIAINISSSAPAAPTGLNATPGAANSSNISLSWTASAGASGYYVKRSTTNGGPYSILAYVTATTWQDTTVTPGVSYYYVISALNAAGEGAHSSQATATVEYIGVLTDTEPVIVPEGGTATFQVKLSRQPTGSGQGNVGVTIARTAGDADITVQSGSSLTFNKTTWNTWQTVTLAAANDADALDSTATIACTPSNSSYATKTVTAIENDTHTTLTITNNGNGSTTPSDALTVAKGASTNISATPANPEYLFGNWSVTSGSATIGNANAASTTVILNEPATIRANFTAKPYAVTYYGDGSSSGSPPVDASSPHPHGSTVTVLGNTGNLAKTGFSFAGWNTASDGSGTTYAPGATFTMPMSNVSLHPVWNQLPTANAGPDQTLYLTANTWSPLPLNPGLWLDAADSQTITTSGGTVSQWADKSGNNRHAGQATTANQPAFIASGLNSKGIVRFDGSSDLFSVDLDFLAGVSHSAFIVTKPTVFNNIYGAANGSQGPNSLHVGFNGGTYRMNYWGNDFTPGRTANFVSGAANIVNYAWTSGIGKEIFANGKSEGSNSDAGLIGTMSGGGRIGSTTGQGYFGGDIAEILIIPGVLSSENREKIEGYLAHKWGLSAFLTGNHPYKSSPPTVSGVSATTTLAGSATDPESNPLTTTWSQTSGPSTAEFANTAALNSKVTFTQEGTYVLQLTAADASGSASDTVTITVHPPIVYRTLTYNGNGNTGGTAPSDPSSPYASGSTVTALGAGTLAKTGHTFAGWNTEAGGGGTAYAANATFTISTDTTLYAQWTANNYTVTFDANGGSAASPSSKQVTYGSLYGTLAATTRTGYSFNGWFTASSGGSQVTESSSVTATNNHTLYAQWTPDTYIVSYHGNGNDGGNIPSPQNKLHDINLTLATNSGGLFKTEHTFTGWNTKADGTGTDYPAGSFYYANSPVTLYAQWGLGTDGTWLPTTAGTYDWGSTASWVGGTIASGANRTASFTANIVADQIANLDSNRTIGNITFNDASHNLAISGTNTLTLARSSAAPVIDVTTSGRTLTISGNITGSNGLQKNGAGNLVLSGTSNTFSGGVSINAGALQINSAANLGDSANVVTFTGNSTLLFSSGTTLSQGFVINQGVTGTLRAGNQTVTVDGPLAGSGTLFVYGTGTNGINLTFTGNNNTFSGDIQIRGDGGSYPSSLTMNSLDDTPETHIRFGLNGAHTPSFTYGAGAVAPLVLNNRQLEHNAGSEFGPSFNNNATLTSSTVTVNTDLILSGTVRNTPFTLGGSNTGDNTFAGAITDGAGYFTRLTKAGAGRWILSNANNNYTGTTTVSGGTLSINSITNVGAGPSAVGAPSTVANGTIAIGSGGTAGTLKYTGSGHTTDRVISLAGSTGGAILDQSGTGPLKFTSNFTAPGASNSDRRKTLTLQGSTAGIGEIAGAIPNSTLGNAGQLATSLSKAGSGTWVLSGANTYTGTTTVSGGILQFGKVSSLYNGTTTSWTAANIRVANGGTLAFNVGGTGEFTSTAISTLFTNLANSTNATTNGMAAGSRFGFDTTNASGGSFEISQAVTNSGGTAGGARGLTKLGTGTLVLSNTNTYTGPTTIHGGTLALTGTTQATTAITFTGGSLGLSTGVTVTASSAAVNLTNGTIQVTGITGAASYTLLTAASITGTPTLASPVSGYELQVVDGNQLRLVQQSLFQIWASTSGLSGGNAASDADPDGDGLTNLQEFAFATNPLEGRPGPIQIDQDGKVISTGLPGIMNFGASPAAADLLVVFPRRKDYLSAGITYTVKFSADLTGWTASNTGLQVLSTESTGDVDAVSVPFPSTVPVSAGGPEQSPRFFRVTVSRN